MSFSVRQSMFDSGGRSRILVSSIGDSTISEMEFSGLGIGSLSASELVSSSSLSGFSAFEFVSSPSDDGSEIRAFLDLEGGLIERVREDGVLR